MVAVSALQAGRHGLAVLSALGGLAGGTGRGEFWGRRGGRLTGCATVGIVAFADAADRAALAGTQGPRVRDVGAMWQARLGLGSKAAA